MFFEFRRLIMINEKMQALGAKRSVIREIFEYAKVRKAQVGAENVFDFSLGNPSVPTPDKLDRELVRLIENTDSIDLHGYTSAQGDANTRRAIADYINKTQDESVNADCLYLTAGAAAALTATLTALVNAGEEVIVPSPFFPEYRVFIERMGGVLVDVPCDRENFAIDVQGVANAINEKTAAVLINSPNNPTGAVQSEETVKALADVLAEKSNQYGKTIYLISDEPYRELVYDGVKVPYPTKYYDNTVICYSYSKALSVPGERIGYVLVCPRMNDFEAVYQAVCGAGRALGFVCAPTMLQKAIPACLGVCADINVYDTNRKLLYGALTEYGYKCVRPDGAFYLFMRSPEEDANAFCEAAKKLDLLLVPADSFGCEGFVRISYCTDTEMIKRALPRFKKLAQDYGIYPKEEE